MARLATKRKADFPPEAGPSRTKQARTKPVPKHYSDLNELNSGSESSGMFVTETSKPKQVQNVRVPKVTRVVPAKKIGKFKRATRVVEEEEDFGRTESQQFLEMVRYGSKKKRETKKANEYLEGFKKVLRKEQEGLEALLKAKDYESSKQDEFFTAAFEAAYTSALQMLAPAEDPDSNKPPNTGLALHKGNALKKQSDLVLKAASELMAEYELCEETIKTLGEKVAVGEKWKDGLERVKRILEGGRLVGKKRVASVMGSVEEDLVRGEMEGEVLFQSEVEKGAWVRVAKRQEKVVRKMTRLLPVE